MTLSFKPMLADAVDLSILKYPVVVSPKLDGVRATFINGVLRTRSLKPLPNRAIQLIRSDYPLDGELIVGSPTSPSVFRDTMKVVSAFDAPIDDLMYHVFDIVYEGSFKSRLHAAHASIEGSNFMTPVPHVLVENETSLLRCEEVYLEEGYEGLMIRDPMGKYKFGRSTAREGALLKMKRKLHSEARVIGFEEQMHNANEAKLDNLGNTERSSHQENKFPMDMLGALIVKDVKTGVEFNVGTGFTTEERRGIWKQKDTLIWKLIMYEYLPYGVKDKPRHPVFISWRLEEDQ
jgi:DNA ligase-1